MRHFHPVLAGAAERFRRYAPGLADRGIDLTVVAAREPDDLPKTGMIDGKIPIYRAETHENGSHSDGLLFSEAYQHFTQREGGVDVIQTTLARRACVPWLWKFRLSGAKTVHAGTMVDEERSKLSPLRWFKSSLRHRWIYAPFDRCIVSSGVMASWQHHMGVSERRTITIPSGVNTHRFYPPEDITEVEHLRERLGLPLKRPIVLFVGNILPRKGLHLLLEAWKRLESHSMQPLLVIIGDWERRTVVDPAARRALQAYQTEVRQLLDQLSPDSHLVRKECADIENWYRACNMLVLPSEQEGMVNVAMEAMSSGLATVITKHTGLPEMEFGGEGTTFLAPDRSVDGIFGVLRLLLDNPDQATELGSQGREHCLQKLSLDRTLDTYAELYKNLAH
jgi:glycosyltransferase involved in cell wall biosynthesis